MTRIAIEATGCDKGFSEVLEGAKKALSRDSSLELILVAGKDRLPRNYSLPKGITLELTNYNYNSEDKNKRKESSIYKAIEIHKNGGVEAVIAPGDTRGAVFYAVELLGLMPNVLSPAIPTHWPRTNVLIDSGANAECKPENLFQFALMGRVYSEAYLKVKDPLIGILTNGKERSKGNRFVMRSRVLIEKLKDKGYNISDEYFEGDFVDDLDAGKVAVVDGHTGNIVLKTAEATIKKSFTYILEEIKKQPRVLQAFAYIGLSKPIQKIKKELRYEEYSTAPLLGVNGNVMMAHGKSNTEAISKAIEITNRYLGCNVNKRLEGEMLKYGKIKISP